MSGTCGLDPIFFSVGALAAATTAVFDLPGTTAFYQIVAIGAGDPAAGALPVLPDWKAQIVSVASGRVGHLMYGPYDPGNGAVHPDYTQKPWFIGTAGTHIALHVTNISAAAFDVIVEAVLLD
jgi:hypothetical protein